MNTKALYPGGNKGVALKAAGKNFVAKPNQKDMFKQEGMFQVDPAFRHLINEVTATVGEDETSML